MTPLVLGDITVSRVVEAEGPRFFAGFLLPDSSDEALAVEAEWIAPRFTVLVDMCIGSDKERPSTRPWHRMRSPLLDRLAAAGVAPEAVDFVLCTHLHVDHVGWNTRLVDGHEIDTGLIVEASPGHSPGHVCLDVKAGGGHAVLSGDLMHHPMQCAYPEWNSHFCDDPAVSRATREHFVDCHAETDSVILAAHFASPVAGRITATGDRCRFATE